MLYQVAKQNGVKHEHRRTGEHPFGGSNGEKPSFARMANTTCLSRGPTREKK